MRPFDRWAIGLTLPAVLLTAVFYVLPIVQVLVLSVTEPSVGLANYEQLLTSRAVSRVVTTTLEVSLWTTLLTIAASYAVAYGLVEMAPGPRRIALFMVLVPFWISVLVRAFSWITILRREGVLNLALMEIGAIGEPLQLVHNRTGVIIGMVHYMMPFAVLLLYANLAGIDRRILQAGRSLGARPATVFWKLWVPLSAPGIAVATLFVFIFSLGFLITPALLGAGRTVMIAEYISVQMTSTLRWGVATGLSTLLLLAVGAVVFFAMRQPALRAAFQGRQG
jgi:putative spermidine/putrescine transport system permease protein